jgi:hypothetical protein
MPTCWLSEAEWERLIPRLVRHRQPQVPRGLKPLCFLIRNGTTKVVPSHLS